MTREELHSVCASMIEELNDLVPTDEQLDRQWNDAHAFAHRASGLSELAKWSIRDEADQQHEFRDHFKRERIRWCALLRALADHGRLSRKELDELIVMARADIKVSVAFEVKGGRPVIEQTLSFDTPYGKWCYGVLALAQAIDVEFRVIACKECGKLALVQLGQHRGKSRSEFCSTAHGNAYRQRQFRKKLSSSPRKGARKPK